MSGRTVITPIGGTPDLEPGEEIRSVTKLTIDERKPVPGGTKSDKDENGRQLQQWLVAEIESFNESKNVFEDFKSRNPDKMSAQELNQLLLLIRGKGWGKWKDGKGENMQGLELKTSDFIDHKTLMASYVDHLAINQWYLAYRKKRLRWCIRYAEQTEFTIEDLKHMNEKTEQEMKDTVPHPIALATQAQIMQKEAEKRPDQITELLNKTLAAKDALFAAMNDLGETVHSFKTTTDAYSKDLHAFKSSVILDLSAAKKEMADVRKFFLEKEHVTEIDRLKEFLDLCDRFKALKDSGVLDVITDVILKLEGA